MNVRRIEEPASFLSVASPLLLADEARHNLMLGLAGTLRDHPDIYPVHTLWVVEHGGHVICPRQPHVEQDLHKHRVRTRLRLVEYAFMSP